jgi:hypothetical protein
MASNTNSKVNNESFYTFRSYMNPIQCDICDGNLYSAVDVLFHHKYLHKNRLKCQEDPKCQREFGDYSNMHSHLYKHSDICLFTCNICRKCYKTKKLVIDHYKIEHLCDICNNNKNDNQNHSQTFPNLKALQSHKSFKHKFNIYQDKCLFC